MFAPREQQIWRTSSYWLDEIAKLLRFGIVGISATLTHLLTAGMVLKYCYSSVFFANITAFVIAFQVSFVGHRYVTFKKKGHTDRFIVAAGLGFIFNNVILAGLVFSGLLNGLLAIFVSTLCVPIIVYALLRFWVFSNENQQS
ncbi:GtrA family protein [Thiorhodococcus drewsii AZ1]|uniref:GtrA family protein n=1 Tax=Thiorhodococcus drewsii AZ1 TaxID=765913 RepID=G2E5A3_9GAMM|nr:GtrA family protein [Thiorhodococcus drewsii]EGV28815.1 GtrA family protein [Thiorhodococcus drewsii AZ1]